MDYPIQNRDKTGRWKKGVSGNPLGRPAKPEAEILRQALEEAKKNYGKHLIEEAVHLAYKSEPIMIALLKKILPDKSSQEVKGAQIEVIFEPPEPKSEESETGGRPSQK